MKIAYHVWGRLPSGCSHGVTLSKERGRALIRKGLAQGHTLRSRGFYRSRVIDVDQHSARELFKGYRYQYLEVSMYAA